MSDGGRFGRWIDDDGAPAFSYGAVERAPDPWHSVSNAGITALAHAGGWTTIYATARGMTRLTDARSTWGMAGGSTARISSVRFGLGRATWVAEDAGCTITRSISVPATGEPVLRVDVRIEHPPGADRPAPRYLDRWVLEPRALLIGGLMSTFEPPPPGYGLKEQVVWRGLYGLSAVVRAATNAARLAIAPTVLQAPELDPARRRVVVAPSRRARDVPADRPAWFDRSLPDLVVALLDDPAGNDAFTTIDVVDGAPTITAPIDDAAVELSYAIALAGDERHLDELIELARAHDRRGLADPFGARAWGAFAHLDAPTAPTIAREATWHAAQLVAAEQHDDHFGVRYIAQGSAYGFIHALQGAPRDYALYAVPMAYLDPQAAREQLTVIMRMARASGSTYYAHTGRGQVTSGGLHAAPTDLPLFFLWSLTDYVWTTGDRAFLDEPIPFQPGKGTDPRHDATPLERAVIAIDYVAERVGIGPHGLLRVGSGDWSDPISAMVPDRRAFHELGESGFNTAFAIYALPRAADLIEHAHPAKAAEARGLADELRRAMEETWTGAWFLRGFDGRGGAIGEHHLFLDGQVWALIAQIGTDAQRRTLVDSIRARNDEPSPIGATILDRPHDVRLGMLAPGWDCNGGVWATINALLAWGYALHNMDAARNNLDKQSLAAHARAYPDIWYGIWSGPDAYNAHFGSRPGETFVQPATPMREFPVMNANAHAGPLLALLRVLGIEATPEGVVVRERAAALGEWALTTPLGSFSPAGFERSNVTPPGSAPH